MIQKSKQLKAEDNKTIGITDLVGLRFKMLKPCNGMVEVVNSLDHGRICTLKVSDFASVADAQVYGQLLVLAPQLLSASLTDAEKLLQLVNRFKQFSAMKKRHKKQRRASAKK